MKRFSKLLSLILLLVMILSSCSANIRRDAANTGSESVRGKITGSTYENAFIGIGCKLDGWTFLTEEEIAKDREKTIKLANAWDKRLGDIAEDEPIIYDMSAESEDGMCKIDIDEEKLSFVQRIFYDEKAFARSQMKVMRYGFERMGIDDVQVSYTRKNIAGEFHAACEVKGEIEGIDFYATLIAIKLPGYMASVSITSVQTNEINTIIKSFYTVENEITENEPVKKDTKIDDAKEKADPTAEDKPEPEDEPAEQEQKPEKTEADFAVGKITGNTYENTFIGIGCRLDGWTFLTDEEIAEMNEKVMGMIDEDYAEMVRNATLVYDMSAGTADGMHAITIGMEKLTVAQRTLLDERSYVELQLDMAKEQLEKMGIENVQISATEKTIAGGSHAAYEASGSINGTAFYEIHVVIELPGYMANIVISSFGTNDIDAILENFYAV